MADSKSIRTNEKNLEIQQQLDKKAARMNLFKNIVPYVGLVFVTIFFLIVTKGKFFAANNIQNLINQSFVLIMIAIGSSFVYAHGGMDFSIGPVAGVAQLVLCLLLLKGLPLPLCILICIVVCVLASMSTAGITLLLGVPVFVGSMAVRTMFSGILSTATQAQTYAVDFNTYSYMNATWIKAVLIIALIAVGYYLFNKTTIGKYNKALGGNPLTAQQAGVNRKRYVLIAYILMGICVGLAATFAFFRTGKATSSSGSGWEFNIMMAIILGGFPMSGGERSKISSAIIGALTVTFLTNGLGLWGLDALLINGVKGFLFVAIVALSYDRSAGKLVD